MTILLFLLCFLIAPAGLTWAFVQHFLSRNPDASRGRILRTSVPAGAILPLLPLTAMVALSQEIYNPVPIAILATAIGALAVGALVCLPLGLALTKRRKSDHRYD